jgi:hypothetical protein
MRIEKAEKKDLSFILPLFIRARKFMQENGNASQWAGTYPAREDIEKDIENGVAYVITEEALRENPLEEMHYKEEASSKEKRIVAYFAFIIGEEQTYKRIVEGRWSSDKEYGTIHRLVSDGKTKGISRLCFQFCLQRIPYLRIDTHQDNVPMQKAIRSFGFSYCGRIFVRDGSGRDAFDILAEQKR